MPLVNSNGGLEANAINWVAMVDGVWELGLFQNDYTPVQGSVIGDLTPANFSGYSGLELTQNWTSPVIDGTRWKTNADPIVQAHSGGGVSNLIYGYYVVDGSGVLMYAERDPSGPRLMAGAGDVYTVVPRYTDRTEP